MKPNKVLAMAAKEISKAWVKFGIGNVRGSLDPNVPALYLIDVQGQRADGVVFTVTVSIDKMKLDVLPVARAVDIAAGLLNNGIQQLMTFTGCGCSQTTECETHKRGAVN